MISRRSHAEADGEAVRDDQSGGDGEQAKQAEESKKREPIRKRRQTAALGEASLSETREYIGGQGQDEVTLSLSRARWQSLLAYRTS